MTIDSSWNTGSTYHSRNENERQCENAEHHGKVSNVRKQPQVSPNRSESYEIHNGALRLTDGVAR